MKNQRKIDLIVVHCSATRINQDFPVEALEACHKARGFHSIGYHYYITKDGVVYPCRPESEEGAHARHYNAHSISPLQRPHYFTSSYTYLFSKKVILLSFLGWRIA